MFRSFKSLVVSSSVFALFFLPTSMNVVLARGANLRTNANTNYDTSRNDTYFSGGTDQTNEDHKGTWSKSQGSYDIADNNPEEKWQTYRTSGDSAQRVPSSYRQPVNQYISYQDQPASEQPHEQYPYEHNQDGQSQVGPNGYLNKK